MSYLGPIITIYRTRCHTLPGGPNPTNNLDVYNLFAVRVRESARPKLNEADPVSVSLSLSFNMIITENQGLIIQDMPDGGLLWFIH